VSAEDAVLPSDWKHPHPFHRELRDGEEVDEKSEGPEFGIGRIRSRVPEMERDKVVTSQFLARTRMPVLAACPLTGQKLTTEN
jgi:hypothetical protein